MTTRNVDHAARLMVEHWGERIAQVRHELGLSQAQLAERLETDQAQVSKWERGVQEPRLARKYAIAEALGVRADVLFPTMP